MHNNMRELRKSRGLTQRELGEASGVAEVRIGHYETGRRQLTAQIAAKIAAALGVTVEQLIGEGTTQSHISLSGFINSEGVVSMEQTQINVPVPPEMRKVEGIRCVQIQSRIGVLSAKTFIFFRDALPGEPLEDEGVVVETLDGRMLLRHIIQGSAPGLWHLDGAGKPERDVKLRAVYKIVGTLAG